jgi:hypothetical protein
MNIHLPAPRRRWPARLVILAVVVVVLALAAATFVLSYTGVHVIALQAGVSTRLARLYPATFDAVLVIACVAAVMLRDARWWVRSYAWLVVILVVAVAGAADAVHAMNVALKHRTMEGVVAATPWVLVLLGFSLLLTILQHSRAQHAAAAPESAAPESGRASLPAEKRTAEQAPVEPLGAIEQPADLGGRRSPAPALPPADPDATFVSDADAVSDVTFTQAPPAVEAPAEVDATPAPDGGITTGADPDRYEDVSATVPELPDEPGEAAVSWHHYWDATQEPDPGSQTYAAVEDPEDQHHPSTPPEAGDPTPGEADLDAPPFATAPFVTVPRLNRVRSTPTPPEADEP